MAELAKVNVMDGMNQITLHVRLVGMKRFAVRLWVAKQLIRLAALVLGTGLEVDCK